MDLDKFTLAQSKFMSTSLSLMVAGVNLDCLAVKVAAQTGCEGPRLCQMNRHDLFTYSSPTPITSLFPFLRPETKFGYTSTFEGGWLGASVLCPGSE